MERSVKMRVCGRNAFKESTGWATFFTLGAWNYSITLSTLGAVYLPLLFAAATLTRCSAADPVPQSCAHSRPSEGHQSSKTSYTALGVWYLAHQQPQCAVLAFRSALNQDAHDPTAFLNLALSYDRLGDLSAEEKVLQTAKKQPTVFPAVYNQSGVLDLAQGKQVQAEREFKSALAHSVHFYAEAANNLGVLYTREARFAEARQILQQVIESSPRFEQGYVNLALAFAAQQRFEEAEATLNRVFLFSPANVSSLTALGMIEVRTGKHREGVTALRKAVELKPAAAAHMNLGIALADSFDLPGALDELNQAVLQDPANASARFTRARLFVDLRQYERAQLDLETAVRLEPRFKRAYVLLAVVARDRQRPEAAVEFLKKVAALDSSDADAYAMLGEMLQKTGNTTDAVIAWKRAVALNPGQQGSLYQPFRSLREQDAKAADQYRDQFAAVQNERENVDRAKMLANSALSKSIAGDVAKAVSLLNQAIELCGACSVQADLHKNLGLIQARSGNLKAGQTALQTALIQKPEDVQLLQALQAIASVQTSNRMQGRTN